jgi:ABC-2 type transport system ATP-binding protein
LNVIEAEGISKRYGDLLALAPFSFTLKEGDFFGCFGPNGAGKSTLLKVLTGQIDPMTGVALVLGKNVQTDPMGVKRGVGIVPEFETPPSFLTASEYLHFVCEIREVKDPETAVGKWIHNFDMDDSAGIMCRDLSKGQRQKIMLAAAFIHEPPLLFLDEPFINLDPIYQRKLKRYLKSYVKNGGTIFMCTHILEIASGLCRKIMIMDRGRVLALGRLGEFEKRPGEGLERVFHRLVRENTGGPARM